MAKVWTVRPTRIATERLKPAFQPASAAISPVRPTRIATERLKHTRKAITYRAASVVRPTRIATERLKQQPAAAGTDGALGQTDPNRDRAIETCCVDMFTRLRSPCQTDPNRDRAIETAPRLGVGRGCSKVRPTRIATERLKRGISRAVQAIAPVRPTRIATERLKPELDGYRRHAGDRVRPTRIATERLKHHDGLSERGHDAASDRPESRPSD